jgi:CubicO group peptidase (beta-lactamase class C family)
LTPTLKNIENIIEKAHSSPGYRYLHFDEKNILVDLISGYEDINNKSHFSENTSSHAFSTTKTFTAVATLILAQEGVVKLDDPVVNYLPEYSIPSAVKIEHLLSHQSGVSNPIPLNWVHLREEHQNFNSHNFADEILKTKAKFKGKPGNKFSYSNINYLILGLLIEKVSKRSYQEFIAEKLFTPISIEEHVMSFEHPTVDHATGYHKNNWFQRLLLKLLINKKGLFHRANNRWLSLNPFYVNGTAYGGLFSHPKALMNYCQQLMPGVTTLLSEDMKAHIFNECRNNRNGSTGMSLGWFTGEIKGNNYICHAGGGAGYYAEIRIYPKLKKGSVIMLNSSGMRDMRILDKIDEQIT